MNAIPRKLAVVTGASTGIGLELARLCAQDGFDLVIAADESLIEGAAQELQRERSAVHRGTRATFPPRKASTSSSPPSTPRAGRSMPWSRMRDAVWAMRFWTRISTTRWKSCTPTSMAPFT